MQDLPKGERVAKVIARSGLCSRRDAERLIAEGRVAVDGEVITSPALNVSDNNIIKVDGKPLTLKEKSRLWIFYKPKGVITSASDPQGRMTVFDVLPENLPRVITIGRLDYNTEGLLLLTNDGAVARHIELPSSGWIRKYRVRAFGIIDNTKLNMLRIGATIDGVRYGAAKIELEKTQNGNSWFIISIKEGKNREIRKMMEYAGMEVNRLIRVSYGPFALGKMHVGDVVEVDEAVLKQYVKI